MDFLLTSELNIVSSQPVTSVVLFISFVVANDVSRSLVRFAVGYPLGKKGLDWLKIHLVTLQGEKKK